MSAGKKTIVKNKLFYLKVCNVLDKIWCYIRKYFIMWDIQPQGKKSSGKLFVNDLKSGRL